MHTRNLIGALAALTFATTACSDAGNSPKSTASEQPAPVVEKASALTEKTKQMGSDAWDATKEASGKAADSTREYYEAAKDKSADYYQTAKAKTAEVVETVSEKSKEYYEAVKEKGSELMENANIEKKPSTVLEENR